ncbi:hypothetical protein L1286_23830, partial [Pseudoalteromonas sp. SMS1]|uniref:hypothetical protein n=1 Tax=Pseudoalteromonas sp. SMS1 TaxID=2908894 RepID=UPI001F390255
YRLRKPAGENWDSTGKTIAWDMKYAEAYTVYISVNTPKGHRYITYQSNVKTPHISGDYAYAVLPSSVTNGQWHTVIRDLEADLKAVEPDNSVLNVNALLIRGSGKIGKVVVSNTTQAELAEQGIPVGAYLHKDPKLSASFATQRDNALVRKVSTLSGANLNSPVAQASWDVYDSTPAGAVMQAEYDEDYGSEVMTLTGNAFHNGYRLRKPGGENWDSAGKTITWDMKYAEAYTVYISVNTPKGHRYITYHPGVKDPYISGDYAYAVLPSSVTNGQWHTVIRDVEADLKAVEPDNSVLNVNALLIRGSGKIGKVAVIDTTKAELAEQGIPVGAYLHNVDKLSAAFALQGDRANYDVLNVLIF